MNKRLLALLISLVTLGVSASLMAGPSCCAAPAQGHAESAQAASPVRLMLASYEKVSNALASDDLAAAQSAARTFAAVSNITETSLACAQTKNGCCAEKKDCDAADKGCASEKKDCCQEGKGCAKSLQALINAKEIKEAREHFKGLSAQAIQLAEKEEGFYVMTCSMAGENGDWLQSDLEIRNPYHGSSMLRCGTVKAKSDTKPQNSLPL